MHPPYLVPPDFLAPNAREKSGVFFLWYNTHL